MDDTDALHCLKGGESIGKSKGKQEYVHWLPYGHRLWVKEYYFKSDAVEKE